MKIISHLKAPLHPVEVVLLAIDGDPTNDKEFERQHKAWYAKSAAEFVLVFNRVWATRPFFVCDVLQAS
jgi:hypothetical protein